MASRPDSRDQHNLAARVAVGEFGGSGRADLLTTTFSKDYFPLFRLDKSGMYQEVASAAGLVTATSRYLGWACGLTDFDNSGRRDFWSANGHVYPTDKQYFQPIAVLRNTGTKTDLAYSYPATPNASYRGGATADFNNDGKVDLLVLPIEGAPVLLRNDTASTNAWVGFRLRGTRSNRDGIGAKVTVEACGAQQSDEMRSGGSYVSRNDPRMHFGLGACGKVDRLTIRWPSGTVQTVRELAIDQYSVVEEPR